MSEVYWVARARSGLESVRCVRRDGAEALRARLIARGHEDVRIVRVTVRRGAEAKRVRALVGAADAYREAEKRVRHPALGGPFAKPTAARELARKRAALLVAALEET